MRFTIRWREAALNDLATAWLKADASQRAAITGAVYSIEQGLKDRPDQKGESRPEGERIMFSAPIGILFHVEEQDCLAIIEQVWLFGTA